MKFTSDLSKKKEKKFSSLELKYAKDWNFRLKTEMKNMAL